ncbi:hypothetical protein GCM10018781_11400 [Kitasatospora indigofera]|uniref:DUF742 domain-containing protein n=2 Tax=Kitasatospora indigofera TaxID=67307 RepID=A0A919FE12_9ACTN|nr:hypothetical protein GCM10018781_11400 [Kitasatospora indigofera]
MPYPHRRREPDPGGPPAGAGPGEPPGAQHLRWYDEAAGPMVRPYAMTKGRTSPGGHEFDLIALVVSEAGADGGPDGQGLPAGPEQGLILDLCRGDALPVAEIAADLDLPLGVVRVLLGDLLAAGLIRVSLPVPPALLPDEHILQEVVHGLRAL